MLTLHVNCWSCMEHDLGKPSPLASQPIASLLPQQDIELVLPLNIFSC